MSHGIFGNIERAEEERAEHRAPSNDDCRRMAHWNIVTRCLMRYAYKVVDNYKFGGASVKE